MFITLSILNSRRSHSLVFFILLLLFAGAWAFSTADQLPAPLEEEFKLEKSPFINEFNRNTGLPVAEVNKLFKDKNGMLWLLCPEGLVRYDGVSFKHYKYNPGDSTSLSDNWVEGMAELPDGRLWIATGKGISVIEPGGGKVYTLQLPDTFEKDRHHRAITSIYYDNKTKDVFFGYNKGVGQISLDGKFKGIYNVFGNDRNYHKITQICRDSVGQIWVCALQFGIYKLNEGEKKITRSVILESSSGKEIFTQPISLSEPLKGRFYINTWGQGILKVNYMAHDTIQIKSLIWDQKPGIEFWSNIATGLLMKVDSVSHTVWFSSADAGFGTLNLLTDEIVIQRVSGKKGMPQIPVQGSDILFANGSLWIAHNSGLWQFCPDNQFLEKYRIPGDNQSYWGIASGFIPADVASDPAKPGTYWLLSEKGVIAKWDRPNEDIHYYYYPFVKNRKYFLAARRIFVLPSHFLLLTDRGNFLQNRKTMEFDKHHPFGFFDTVIVSDIVLLNSDLWLVSTDYQGIFLYHPSKNKCRRIHGHVKSLGHLRTARFYNNKLFLTGSAGAFKMIDTLTGKNLVPDVMHIQNSIDTLNGLYRSAIQGINKIWMASPYGLFVYRHPENQVVSWPNPVYGKNHWIQDVVGDQYGNIWYLSRSFLGYIGQNQKMQYTFDHSNGLEQETFQALRLCDDSALFVLSNSNFYYKPANVRQPEFRKPIIRLESVEIDGKPFSGPIGSEISVPASVKSLELSFLNLRFGASSQFGFLVKVKSTLGDTFNFSSSKISLPFVKPGRYKVTAVAFDKNNLWNSDRLEIMLVVRPNWYSTIWASLLFAILLIALAAIFFRFIIKRKERQNEEKRRIEKTLSDLEMSTLRAQINPHFIFNSLNSIQNYILANKALDASDYLAKFSRLIRLVLESSMENVITIKQERELLEHYLDLEKLRTNHKFNYSIYIDSSLSDSLKIPSMLAQPYLENSIWHGFNDIDYQGVIELSFLKQSGFCLCIIKDNGRGRNAIDSVMSISKKHKPRGTAITKMRLELISPDIDKAVEFVDLYSKDGNRNGTEVRIKIPIHEN